MRTIYKCFPGGKFKVLTMSYDDGRDGDRRLVSIFNKYGIRGTFNLNSGLIDRYEPQISDKFGGRIKRDEFRELYKNHEVACHTLTHPTIERCPMTEVVKQVMEDRQELESIMGYPVRGLAYPNGSYTEEIKKLLPNLGIEYSRIVGSTDNFGFPKDFLEWKATCHHSHNLLKHADEFLALNKKQYLYMFYVWGHSFEFARDDSWDLIEEFCAKMANNDDIWYATNIEIVDYFKLWDNLKFSADGTFVYNPSAKSAWVSVDGKIYEVKGGTQVKFE